MYTPNVFFIEERAGKQGLGTAYIHGSNGLSRATTTIFLKWNADFSHNPEDLLKLRQACIDGADAAIGSRYSNGETW